MKRIFKVILLALVAILVVGMPVMAAVSYRATYTITNTTITPYGMLPVIEASPNEWLAGNGFIQDDALDTRIETLGGLEKPHLVVDDKTLTAVAVPANSQTNLYFTTANADSDMDIITGYNGYITIADDADLELVNSFVIEQSGYINTDVGAGKNLVNKGGAFATKVTAAEEISSFVFFEEPIEVTPGVAGSWQDVDVTAYVPSSATGVIVHLYNTAQLINSVRMNGSIQDLKGDLANITWAMVGIDGDDVFESYVEHAVNCNVFLLGYTGAGVTYKAAMDDVSIGAMAWTDIDLVAECPDAVGVIIYVVSADAAVKEYGLQHNDSTDDRKYDVMALGFQTAVIGCDSSQVIEGYVEDVDVDFWVQGYITEGATFFVNGVDKSQTNFAVWEDIDISANVSAGATHAIVECFSLTGGEISLRRVGSVYNPTNQFLCFHSWGIVGVSDGIYRSKSGQADVDQFVVGYLTTGSLPIQAVVTATTVDNDNHIVKTTLSGGTLEISVDSAVAGALYGSVAFAGNVPDTDDGWVIMDNSATQFFGYMDYYKHTTAVGGLSLKAWYQPNYMVIATDYDGEADGGTLTTIIDAELVQEEDYWVGALVTVTWTTGGDGAPSGEYAWVTDFNAAADRLTFVPAMTVAPENLDLYTVDFGTLIDRSYYGLEFDAADDIVACGAAADMDITDKATLTAWVYIDTDGENDEGSIIDRRDATPDGYRLYVSSEAGGNVAIEAILDCATDAYAKTAVEISTGAWHYIVAVYDRLGTNHWEIYEDGTLLTLGTDTAGVGAIVGHTANVMNIGDNAASDRCFDGKIDEPSFYTTAWTQALVTANYNAGAGLYTPTDTTSIALQLHMEEGTGAAVADTSGEVNNGTITNAVWVNGKVPRPAGNAGTNDSRLTWGANPTGVAVTIGGMVSSGQPTPGSIPTDPAQDILPETAVTDWFIEPAVGTTLLNNPLRPFVIMMSGDGSPTDTNTLTEIQAWRILALAIILLITVATAISVGRHQGITAIMAGVAILGAVVLTIFPMWALVFAIGMFIGGLVMERAPSL